MRPISIVVSLMLLAGFIPAKARQVKIDTPSTTLLLQAKKGEKLRNLYYGGKLSEKDAASLKSALGNGFRAYPDYGMMTVQETALALIHSDGNMTLDLVVDDVAVEKKKDSTITSVLLKDTYYPVEVNVKYLTRPGSDVIETWTEITNHEGAPVKLTRFASGYLPIHGGDVWLSHLYGNAKNEGRLEQEPLTHGMKIIKNRDGVRNSQLAHAEVMFSLDGRPSDRTGRTIGAALCYGGNYKLRIDTDHTNNHYFFAGINEEDSQYPLADSETFVTPTLALTYSPDGTGGASRNFHSWARDYKLMHGHKPRKVLLNSWEGVYFGVNEREMSNMMKNISDMGGELFVMDDGWFGTKYPRNDSHGGLGDWTVDTRKLPHGINGLLKEAKKNNISFGIWIEPEMVNTRSELYEQHPEYVIKPEHREALTGRGGTQLVLDMANPAVQKIVFNIVDTLLTKYPEIDYIKWDANMDIKNHGSQYQTADGQSRLFIDYHRGLAKALDRIRAKYPDVTIQACASGGGRANYGVLPWFDEFWVSDNTDALQRIYMQWGASYFFPSIAMASHISASPNHQTQRRIPIKYRTDVAMSGRLGMEIQPDVMTEAEKTQTRKAISEYKEYRDVIQQGDLYRLLSPYDDKGLASLMYVSPDKKKSVFYWWKLRTFWNDMLPLVRMDGLDPDKTYTIRELNRIDRKPLPFEGKSFSGRFLMENGLEIPYNHDLPSEEKTDWSSRVLALEEN